MTTQKNGTTIPTNGKALPINGTPDKKIENVVSIVAVKKEAAEPSPLEDRLLRINQLFELQTRHTRLNKSLQKLDEFQLKKGEENIRFTIDDENNRDLEFTTTNPEVIAEALAFVRSTIIDRKKKIEALLVI